MKTKNIQKIMIKQCESEDKDELEYKKRMMLEIIIRTVGNKRIKINSSQK